MVVDIETSGDDILITDMEGVKIEVGTPTPDELDQMKAYEEMQFSRYLCAAELGSVLETPIRYRRENTHPKSWRKPK